ALCWKVMVTGGTESADSTISCVEPTSIRKRTTWLEKQTEKRKAARALSAPRRLLKSNLSKFLLAHPEGIERRLVDRCRLSEPIISLVSGERLPSQRP